LNSNSQVSYEIITELPVEFNKTGTMSWKLINFENKCFDAIIGQNILTPMSAIIDMVNRTLTLNGNTIHFISAYPFPVDEIHTLEKVRLNSSIIEKLSLSLNSEESKALRKLSTISVI